MLFYGWVIVFAAQLISFAASGSGLGSFAVFLDALLDYFGWSRASVSLGLSLNTGVGAFGGVLAGLLMNRWGPRRMVVTGALVSATSLMLVSLTTQPWHFYLSFGFLLPFGLTMTSGIVTTTTVRRWFVRRAALAVSLAMTGGVIGGAAFPPIAYALIESFGWQTTYRFMALILVIGAIAGALLLRTDPESEGTHPDGIPISEQEKKMRADLTTRSETWSVKEVLKTRTFWLLIAGETGIMTVIIALLAHLKVWAYKDLGLGEGFAVSMVSLLFGIAAAGRLLGGFVSDLLLPRFGRKPVLLFSTIGVTASIFFALTVRGQSMLALMMVILGLTYGSGVGVFSTYLGDLYGVVSLPVVLGLAGVETHFMSALGPWFFGYIFDRLGSYNLAFLIAGIICSVSVLCVLLITPPVKKKGMAVIAEESVEAK